VRTRDLDIGSTVSIDVADNGGISKRQRKQTQYNKVIHSAVA